jgi:hypothetical protein
MPRGKSLAGATQAELDEVARKLNDRLCQTLGFRTPAENSPSGSTGSTRAAPRLTRFGLRPSLDSPRLDETIRTSRGGALTG